jgi:NADH-quinone oxidoreductase subunit C
MHQGDGVYWLARVCEALPEGALLERQLFGEQATLIVASQSLLEVMRILRDTFSFRYLTDLTALDFYPVQPRFQVVYHLWSHQMRREAADSRPEAAEVHQMKAATQSPEPGLLRIKVAVDENPPAVPSVAGLWSSANWHERECYDLFGIFFNGHPDLRRILLPDDWEGHPLLKDYPLEGF